MSSKEVGSRLGDFCSDALYKFGSGIDYLGSETKRCLNAASKLFSQKAPAEKASSGLTHRKLTPLPPANPPVQEDSANSDPEILRLRELGQIWRKETSSQSPQQPSSTSASKLESPANLPAPENSDPSIARLRELCLILKQELPSQSLQEPLAAAIPKSENKPSLSLNQRFDLELTYLFQERGERIYWIPHGKFETDDLLHFPARRVNFFSDMNIGTRFLVNYFGKDQLIQMYDQQSEDRKANRTTIGDNDFLKWLNGDARAFDREQFYEPTSNYFFMNCADFVYLALYQAKLISKEGIAHIYRNQIANNLNGTGLNSFYGFNLTHFRDFDPKNGAGEPGDILIGFVDGEPAHVMFLSEKSSDTGNWKGAGLWNMGTTAPRPSDIDLERLQRACDGNQQTLTFKRCSLETALKTLGS